MHPTVYEKASAASKLSVEGTQFLKGSGMGKDYTSNIHTSNQRSGQGDVRSNTKVASESVLPSDCKNEKPSAPPQYSKDDADSYLNQLKQPILSDELLLNSLASGSLQRRVSTPNKLLEDACSADSLLLYSSGSSSCSGDTGYSSRCSTPPFNSLQPQMSRQMQPPQRY